MVVHGIGISTNNKVEHKKMRKVSLFIVSMAVASSMLFVGCKKDQQFERLGVSIEKATGDSKLYLDDDYNPVFIQSGESINVNGTAYNVVYNNGQYNVTVDCSRPFYAAYPASLTSGFTGTSSQSVTLPRWQKYEKVQVGTDREGNPVYKQNIKMPAAAAITDNSTKFYFYNLCSLLEVQWKNTSNKAYQIIGIEVTVPGQAIWGEGTASIAGTSSTLTLTDDLKNRVNLDIAESDRETVAAGGTSNKYYVVLPTFSHKNVTVRIQVMSANASGSGNDADDQKLKTITVYTNETNGVTMHRNYIIPMHVEATPKEDNSLTGYFSVSPTLKVVFSRGNLQHCGGTNYSTGTWKFADRQYDFFGGFNVGEGGYLRTDYTDLFTWSNSESNDYGIHVYDDWDDADNWLSSGNWREWGNMPIQTNASSTSTTGESNVWFTLTAAEWNYLIDQRVPDNNGTPKALDLRGRAKITGIINHPSGNNVSVVYGFILLPDDWESEDLPSGLSFDPDVINEYDQAEWARMEAAGAMFLPAAGWTEPWGDDGYQVVNMYEGGAYWSSTRLGSGNSTIESQYLSFNYTNNAFTVIDQSGYNSQWYYSRSVRLVKAAPGYTVTGRWQQQQ